VKKHFFVFSDDERSKDVRKWVKWLKKMGFEITNDPSKATEIDVVGGDGTLMHAIHDYHTLEVPFLGIDRGTIGFNLNPVESYDDLVALLRGKNIQTVIKLELAEATIYQTDGNSHKLLAFNDVFVEASTMVDGRVITKDKYAIDKYFRANGIIVATPQGSTSYNYSAGGRILPLEEKLLAIQTICPQGYPIEKITDVMDVEVSFKARSSCRVLVDFQKVEDTSRFVVKASGKFVRIVFSKSSHFQLKRQHVKEETERRRDKWIPKDL
jgi:NAD+ kinase